MRIVFLITMGIERPGGVRYFHIARELVRLGYSVRILALHPDLEHCTRRRYVQDGVEIWYVGQMHARKTGTILSTNYQICRAAGTVLQLYPGKYLLIRRAPLRDRGL